MDIVMKNRVWDQENAKPPEDGKSMEVDTEQSELSTPEKSS
jgi:hypothetical protein